MSHHYEIGAGGTINLVVETPTRFTRSAQTARNDAQIEVQPGVYPMKPVTIGWHLCPVDEAYYFTAVMDGTLKFGGYHDEAIGSSATVSFSPYGYEVRNQLDIPTRRNLPGSG